jgi:hypothetical protein
VDYTIVYELVNGSKYYKKRDIVSATDATFHCDQEDVIFFNDLVIRYGVTPIPVILVNHEKNSLYFGSIDTNAISKSYVTPTLIDISFSIQEAI